MTKYKVTFPQSHPDSTPSVVCIPVDDGPRLLYVRRDALLTIQVEPPDDSDPVGPENLYDLFLGVAGFTHSAKIRDVTELEVNTLLRWHAGFGIGTKGRELVTVLP